MVSSFLIVQFSSVQWVSTCLEKPLSAQQFLQHCLWNSCSVCLTDDGPLLSFQRTSSSAFSFRASLLQAVGGAVSLAYCWLRWALPAALCFQPSSGTLSFPPAPFLSLLWLVVLTGGLQQSFPSCPVSVTAVAGCADRWPSAKLPLLSQCVKQLLFHKGTPACLWKTGPGTEMDEPQL